MKHFLLSTLALLPALPAWAQAQTPAKNSPYLVAPRVASPARSFPLSQVRLLQGRFQKAQQDDHKYLLFLSPDRFLHNFHKNAGLEPKAPIYGGWESQGVAGQTMGHYMSALAMMFQSTGDQELKRRLDYIVDELARCQDKNGNGYVSAIPDGAAMFADVKAGKGNGVHRGWVPWYTMHKLFAGLHDAHVLTGNPKALQVLVKLSNWAIETTANLSDEQWDVMLTQEHGGMNEALADVYALTGDAKYLELARKFSHRLVLNPASQGRDNLNGLHANTQIPKFIGFERIGELSGDAKYGGAARFFWDTVTQKRSYAIGGNSDHEHFFDPSETRSHLSSETAETCNTYNMLRLTRALWQKQPEASRMDFYERALFNQILGSQDPESNGQGHFNYLTPLKAGAFKVYSHPTDAMWCCVGTGIENHAKYGDTIYFQDARASALYVNLFIASELKWPEKGLSVRQETRLPDEDTVRLIISAVRPVRMALKVRHPAWASGMSIQVNGRAHKMSAGAGSYESIERTWKAGDVVSLKLPMSLRLEELANTPEQKAILFGPIVLAGDLGREGLNAINDVTTSQVQFSNAVTPPAPVFVGTQRDILNSIRRVPGRELRFQARMTDSASGQERTVPMLPFSRAHHTRYGVYWNSFDAAGWERKRAQVLEDEKRAAALALRTLNEFRPGEQQNEKDHALQSERSNAGEANGRKWRDAGNGGFFTFDLKVQPDALNTLRVTYWGGESGNRTFDILIDGQKLATQKLSQDKPNEFFEREYAIPAEVTRGKTKVSVRFQAQPNNMAGGIFGARMLRP